MTPEELEIRRDQMERACEAICDFCERGMPLLLDQHQSDFEWPQREYYCRATLIRRAWAEQIEKEAEA